MILNDPKGDEMQNTESVRKSLEDALPPIVPRHGIQKYGIPYSEGHLANLDSRGEGPTGAVRIGNRVCYPRVSLIEWLLARSKAKTAK
jgi:hypothetical protein